MDELIKILPYLGTIALVGCAFIALLRNTRQGHAAFLLQLDARWEALEGQRKAVSSLSSEVRNEILTNHAKLSDEHRIEKLREKYKEVVTEAADTDPDMYRNFITYLGFFETVGLMVKKGYMPLREVLNLYRGPILDIDMIFIEYINEKQKQVDVPEGLFQNVIYLSKMARRNWFTRIFVLDRWCWW